MLKRLWNRGRSAIGRAKAGGTASRWKPAWEALEARQLLSGPGVDYNLSGFSWSDPSHITYSIPADGTSWDGAPNNLNATLTAAKGDTSWKRDIAKALQTWASVANINVVPVADSNASFNTWGQSQGDARFGDIRVGGYVFPNNLTTLAQTFYPPPNGSTAAGDVEVNTGFTWKPGTAYDFYSVLQHETGHSLGLEHSQLPTAVMYASYGGLRTGLTPDDVAGIQAIYGPRTPDAYQSAGVATSFNTAADITSRLNVWGGEEVPGVSLATIGDTEYFSIVAPAGATGSTLKAAAMASGVSSLSPKITVYDAAFNPLGSGGDPSAWSDNAGVSVGGIQAGHRYYMAVTGATSDVFAVGAYTLGLAFAGMAPPAAPAPPSSNPPSRPATPPPVLTPPAPVGTVPSIPRDRFEPDDAFAQTVNLGTVNQAVIPALTIDTVRDVDLFTFQAARSGTGYVATGATMIYVVNQSGQVVSAGKGMISFNVPQAGQRFYLVLNSADGRPVAGYSLGIAVVLSQGPAAQKTEAAREVVAPRLNGDAYTPAPTVAPSNPIPGRVNPTVRWKHKRTALVAPNWGTRPH